MAHPFSDRYQVGRNPVGLIASYSRKAPAFALALRSEIGTEVFDVCACHGDVDMWICREADGQKYMAAFGLRL